MLACPPALLGCEPTLQVPAEESALEAEHQHALLAAQRAFDDIAIVSAVCWRLTLVRSTLLGQSHALVSPVSLPALLTPAFRLELCAGRRERAQGQRAALARGLRGQVGLVPGWQPKLWLLQLGQRSVWEG